MVGHISPEAFDGGLIALVEDDDIIAIDAVANTIDLKVDAAVIEKRREQFIAPACKVKQGVLYKYALCVSDASKGCITDLL